MLGSSSVCSLVSNTPQFQDSRIRPSVKFDSQFGQPRRSPWSAQVDANLHSSTPSFIEHANTRRLRFHSYLHDISNITALSDANTDNVLERVFAPVAVLNLDSKHAFQTLRLAGSKHKSEMIRCQTSAHLLQVDCAERNKHREHRTLEENNIVFDPPGC